MEKVENLRKSLTQLRQVQLQRLQDPLFLSGDISQSVECIKTLNYIDSTFFKIDLFQDIHDVSRIDEIDDFKQKTFEELLYDSVEESFPKTLKIVCALKYMLPKIYKDFLYMAFETNDFKDVSYLLPMAPSENSGKSIYGNPLRPEFWNKVLKAQEAYKVQGAWLFLEDIIENLNKYGQRDRVQTIVQKLLENPFLEIMERKHWHSFVQEMYHSQKGVLFVEVAERILKESGNLRVSLKILEDGFFQNFPLQLLRERILLYSIASLMIYKIGIFTFEVEDMQALQESSLIRFLFETVMQSKPNSLLQLKTELKSIFILYSSEEKLAQLFEEYLLSLDVRTFYSVLTLEQKNVERTDQLLIEDDYRVFDVAVKYIEDNCYFEHFEFINKVVKLLKASIKLEIRLELMEDLERLEFEAECIQLMFNFHINHKYAYLSDFEEIDKLAQSRERGLDILSQIVTNFNKNQIRSHNVTLKGKPIDIKNVRSVLNVLLHLQEHVMKKCIDVQLVYQVFIKKLLEFGNYKDVQNLIDKEKLLTTINKDIFEMIVLESVSKILDNLQSISQLDDDSSYKIKKCFDLIPWDSEAKEAEKSLYKACLELKKTELAHLSPTYVRSCNKIELLNEIIRSSPKAHEKIRFVELYELLKKAEYASVEGDPEFVGFMANFVDSYLENNERRKIEDLVNYLVENNYGKLSEVLRKIITSKAAAIRSNEKKYYTKLGILKCDNGALLSEYLNDQNLPYLKDYEKDVVVENPENIKVVLVNFELFTPDFYNKKNDFETSWKIKNLFTDTMKKVNDNNAKDELLLVFSNLAIDHKKAFKFLLRAPQMKISTIDTIVESLLRSGLFNIKNFSDFLLNYVIKDLIGYKGKEVEDNKDFGKFGSASDFERIVTKYKSLTGYSQDFASFGSLVDVKDQARFLFEEDFRKELISNLIVSTHSEPRIIEKAYKYGLDVNSINLKLLESKFLSLREGDLKAVSAEMKLIIEKVSIHSVEERAKLMNVIWETYENASSLKYFPVLVQIASEKDPNMFHKINLKYMEALINIGSAEDFREFISLNSLLTEEYKDARYEKPFDLEKFKEAIARHLRESNVFIVSKSLPLLVPNTVNPSDIQFILLKHQVCKPNLIWGIQNLERIFHGTVEEDSELRMFVERFDMFLDHLDYKSLGKLIREIVHISMDQKSFAGSEEIPLVKFIRLSLSYQQYFIGKINKKMKEIEPKVDKDTLDSAEENINTGSIIGVKIKLMDQLASLYQNSIGKVLSLKDLNSIRSTSQLSNFIFGLFNKEIISSSMLVGFIKDLGKDAFIKGYLKNELNIKLEETSIEISDRLYDIWDTAIIFREVTSANRLHKLNFQVKFEVIEANNKHEFEGLVRFLQKTNELFILDEDFARQTKDSLNQVLVSMVVENNNYSFRLKLQLLHLAFKYLPQIAIVNERISKEYVLEIFALLDKAFNEFEISMQYARSLLNILLAENPHIHLVQLFDGLVFAPKDKPFYQNLVLRDICLRLPSDDLILHALGNLINFNIHEDLEMIFDLFFVRKTKAVKVEREVSAKIVVSLILEDMAYKLDKEKVETNLRNLIGYIVPDSKEVQLVYKYLVYKGKINLLKKTEHYDYCLKFAYDIFRAQKRLKSDPEVFTIEEVLDYGSDIHEICFHELWAGKTLEHVLLKNVINLTESENFIEAARLVNEYFKDDSQDYDPVPVNKTFESLKSFVDNIIKENRKEYSKFDSILINCYNRIKKL